MGDVKDFNWNIPPSGHGRIHRQTIQRNVTQARGIHIQLGVYMHGSEKFLKAIITVDTVTAAHSWYCGHTLLTLPSNTRKKHTHGQSNNAVLLSK